MNNFGNKLSLLLENIYKKGFFYLLSANIGTCIVSFASQFFVAWILTPRQLGEIKILQTYGNFAVNLASLGLTTSTLKLCSENRAPGEKKYLFLSAFRYNLLAAVVVWIALVIFSWLKIISRDLEINRLLRVFSISLFPATLSGLMLVYLQAMGKFKDISRVNISAKIGSLLLIIGFTFFFKINGYVAGSVSGGFFLMFLVFRIMRKNIGKISGRSVPDVWKIHWSLAGFSYFDLLIAQFANSIDIFLLNLLVNERNEIGQYSFATTVTAAMLIIIGTVQQIATPHLTFKAKNRSEWKQSFKKYNRHWLCACCLVSSMVLFGTPWLIGLVFKMKYFHFMLYFPVLWSAWFVKAGYSLVGPALISLGRTDVNFYTSLLKVLFAVTVTFHMIQKMGIVGAAYATLLVQLFGFVTEYGSLLLILKKSG